jgi:hypothetical protein
MSKRAVWNHTHNFNIVFMGKCLDESDRSRNYLRNNFGAMTLCVGMKSINSGYREIHLIAFCNSDNDDLRAFHKTLSSYRKKKFGEVHVTNVTHSL